MVKRRSVLFQALASASMVNLGHAQSEAINVRERGAIGDGRADDTGAIQKALDESKGRPVYFPPGVYCIREMLKASGDVRLIGSGPSESIIQNRGPAHVLAALGPHPHHIEISFLGLDGGGVGGGVILESVLSFSCRGSAFYNTLYWSLSIGSADHRSVATSSREIKITNCYFQDHYSTYEHCLLFNCRDIEITKCYFSYAVRGIGVGLYQNVSNATISDCVFTELNQGIYYSISCNNLLLERNRFLACDTGVKGSNKSDNGDFNSVNFRHLSLSHCIFKHNNTGLQLGAVENATISDCLFSCNRDVATVISHGNAPVRHRVEGLLMRRCRWDSNNTSPSLTLLHPALLLHGECGGTGIIVEDCVFTDDRLHPLQEFPIAILGSSSWELQIRRSSLQAFSKGSSIYLSPTLARAIVSIADCRNLTIGPS